MIGIFCIIITGECLYIYIQTDIRKGLQQSSDIEFRTSKWLGSEGGGGTNYSDCSISCSINASRYQTQCMLMDDNMDVFGLEYRRGERLSKNDLCHPGSSPLLLVLLLSFHSLHFFLNNEICSLQMTGFAYRIHFNSSVQHFHNSLFFDSLLLL